MSDMDDLRRALYHDEAPSRREIRAARTRAQALAPGRILMRLLTLPLLALGVALSIYIRTSDYDPPDALAHLMARGGCDAARYVGLAPAYQGGLGYHARNDADGDGVACAALAASDSDAGPESVTEIATGPVHDEAFGEPVPTRGSGLRMVGGAKFVKP